MAWTQPKTWTNEPLIAADMNTNIRDNLDALKEPPSDDVTLTGAGSNVSIANTSWLPIGGAGTETYSITITLAAGDSGSCNGLIGFYGNFAGAAILALDVAVDGTRISLGDDGAIAQNVNLAAPGYHMAFTMRYTGLPAGAHTFVMYCKVNTSTVTHYRNAGTANADMSPQFWVRSD